MKALLFIILFFILLVMIVGFGIIRTVFKLFFGGNRQQTVYKNQQTRERETEWNNNKGEKKKEKLFSKEEGEYVDFEEIKDDTKK